MEPTIRLNEETSRMLVDIAWRNGLSLPAAVGQVVANQLFLDRLESQGHSLLILKKGRLRRLVKVPAGASFRERRRLLGLKGALGF